ncbi:MAG: hypothetical protein ACOX4J_01585 [Anaerovoracaceae bacterium]|jgi:hypothetical protein
MKTAPIDDAFLGYEQRFHILNMNCSCFLATIKLNKQRHGEKCNKSSLLLLEKSNGRNGKKQITVASPGKKQRQKR